MISMMEMGIVMITRLNKFPVIKLNETYIAKIIMIIISKMFYETFVEKS